MLATLAPVLSGVGVAPVTSSYFSIATQTVGSGGASSVTFSSIPSTYTHLQIRGIARSNRNSSSDNLYVRVGNGSVDSSANYAGHILGGNGTSAFAAGYSTADGLTGLLGGYLSDFVHTSGVFAGSVIDILDYANTSKNKTCRALSGFDNNGTGIGGLHSGLWLSTSAINIVTLLPLNGTSFDQYSSFALYGVK